MLLTKAGAIKIFCTIEKFSGCFIEKSLKELPPFWVGCAGFLSLLGFLFPVAVSGGYSSLRCAGFSLWRLLSLWSTGFSVCHSRAAEHRLNSCGAQA